jgi:hypothetical protein
VVESSYRLKKLSLKKAVQLKSLRKPLKISISVNA